MRLGLVHKYVFGSHSNEAIAHIRNNPNQFFTILCVILNLFPSESFGSILNKMSVREMTRSAKEVQIGEVVSTWVSPDPDQKMFFTFVKVKVEKTLKGKAVSEILLRQPGGTYRDPNTNKVTRQKVFGMESFQKGEKAVFFITHANDGAPMAMFQGKYQIVKDLMTGEDMTIHDSNPRDVEFANRADDHENSLYATYEQKPLIQMVSEIQGAMNIQKGE